jgi:signal transduction histidine kinase
MNKTSSNRNQSGALGRELSKDFPILSRRILSYANRDVSRVDFVREVSKVLLEFSGCDAVEMRAEDDDLYCVSDFRLNPKNYFKFTARPRPVEAAPPLAQQSDFEILCANIFLGAFDPNHPLFTQLGTFWTGDTDNPITIKSGTEENAAPRTLAIGGDYKTIAIIPFVVDEENSGLLILKSMRKYFLTKQEVEFYEGAAQTFGVAVSCRRAQAALRERVKELTCMYSIARVVKESIPIEVMLQRIVEFLPPAWQYPEMASARIVIGGHAFVSPGFSEGRYSLVSDIFANMKKIGKVEVVYQDEVLEFEEDPFLPEERKLIDAVAHELGVMVEMDETEKDKARLQEQLRHADRLATIGQFAAGVAHEINEPLGKILGFAQLSKKCADLPEAVGKDLDKIIGASLHAREIVRKLLVFSRQVPQMQADVCLNKIISEELYFFESQCGKQGIKLVRSLQPNLPPINGDPAQLNQVLVNLVVNAIQAMPGGGALTISTISDNDCAHIIVEDTGIGMSEETKKKIFLPFFTTKEVGKGTGLGLSVVHGIVTSHGGNIQVESRLGHGSKFDVAFPVMQPPAQETERNG